MKAQVNGYVRVSAKDQNINRQMGALAEYKIHKLFL